MSEAKMKRTTDQQRLSWGVLLCVVTYFLSLCTLSPSVHADLLSHTAQGPRPTVGHCATPSPVPKAASPAAADQENTTVPLCCGLVGTNKSTRASSAQAAPLLVLTPIILPIDVTRFIWGREKIAAAVTLHPSLSPPLYILYIALLI